jgi:hypothetical protein
VTDAEIMPTQLHTQERMSLATDDSSVRTCLKFPVDYERECGPGRVRECLKVAMNTGIDLATSRSKCQLDAGVPAGHDPERVSTPRLQLLKVAQEAAASDRDSRQHGGRFVSNRDARTR